MGMRIAKNSTFGTFIEIKIGDTVTAFNSKEWQKTGDIGNNEQFYQEAKVLDIRESDGFKIFDLLFIKSNVVSLGHFAGSIKKKA